MSSSVASPPGRGSYFVIDTTDIKSGGGIGQRTSKLFSRFTVKEKKKSVVPASRATLNVDEQARIPSPAVSPRRSKDVALPPTTVDIHRPRDDREPWQAPERPSYRPMAGALASRSTPNILSMSHSQPPASDAGSYHAPHDSEGKYPPLSRSRYQSAAAGRYSPESESSSQPVPPVRRLPSVDMMRDRDYESNARPGRSHSRHPSVANSHHAHSQPPSRPASRQGSLRGRPPGLPSNPRDSWLNSSQVSLALLPQAPAPAPAPASVLSPQSALLSPPRPRRPSVAAPPLLSPEPAAIPDPDHSPSSPSHKRNRSAQVLSYHSKKSARRSASLSQLRQRGSEEHPTDIDMRILETLKKATTSLTMDVQLSSPETHRFKAPSPNRPSRDVRRLDPQSQGQIHGPRHRAMTAASFSTTSTDSTLTDSETASITSRKERSHPNLPKTKSQTLLHEINRMHAEEEHATKVSITRPVDPPKFLLQLQETKKEVDEIRHDVDQRKDVQGIEKRLTNLEGSVARIELLLEKLLMGMGQMPNKRGAMKMPGALDNLD